MMILITGGCGSGKSAYAEEYISQICGKSTKYYLATMQVFDDEGQLKAERHRKLRSGKGFLTVEQPSSICEVLGKMKATEEKSAMLECMSNLVANEMFSGETIMSCKIVTDKIIREMELLRGALKYFVIVTNNVFEDGFVYDKATIEYMNAMGSINKQLAAMADVVIEVVAGIPLIMKERN